MGRAFALVIAWLGLIACFSLPYRDRMGTEPAERADAVLASRGFLPSAADEQPAAELHNGRANEARKLAAQRRDLETEPEVSGEASVAAAAPAMTKIVISSAKADVSLAGLIDRAAPATATQASIGVEKPAHVTGKAEPALAWGKQVSRQKSAKSRKSPVALEVAEEADPATRLKVAAADVKPARVMPPPMRLTSVGDAAATVALPKVRKDGKKVVQKHAAPPPPVIAAIDQAAADKMRRKSWKQDARARDIALYKPDGI